MSLRESRDSDHSSGLGSGVGRQARVDAPSGFLGAASSFVCASWCISALCSQTALAFPASPREPWQTDP